MLSPPLDMSEKWFAPLTAYSMAKYGMSLCRAGARGRTAHRRHRRQRAVAAHHHRHGRDQNLLGGDAIMRASRTPEILARCRLRDRQAATRKLHRPFLSSTIRCWQESGVTDFEQYRADPIAAADAGFLRAGGFRSAAAGVAEGEELEPILPCSSRITSWRIEQYN